MELPEFIRELRPHFTFKGLELLWKLVEAAVKTALVWLLQYVKTHLDVSAFAVIFVGGMIVLVLGSMRTARTHPGPAAPATSPSTHDAPKILIEYRRSGEREDLGFFNDGPHSAMTFTLEPLVWQEKRYITLAHSIPPLAAKQRHVCQMFFEGSPSHGYPLVDYLRERTPKDARTTVNLIYTDHQNKRMFSREFSLETFGDGTLAWQPGEVKPLGPNGEPIK
jgi:hypothetical protein